MVYDGLRGAGAAADDVVMLSRSFFVGGARFGAAAWSGDVPSTFASLHEQVSRCCCHAVSSLRRTPHHTRGRESSVASLHYISLFTTRCNVYSSLKSNAPSLRHAR
jgi:hypothetical protein